MAFLYIIKIKIIHPVSISDGWLCRETLNQCTKCNRINIEYQGGPVRMVKNHYAQKVFDRKGLNVQKETEQA